MGDALLFFQIDRLVLACIDHRRPIPGRVVLEYLHRGERTVVECGKMVHTRPGMGILTGGIIGEGERV